MKRTLLIAALLLAGISAGFANTPPSPSIPAREALRLADAYVAKTFPQFPDLYCAELTYELATQSCIGDPNTLWRLRYLLPSNSEAIDPKTGSMSDGVCLIYISPKGKVRHTTEPKRNPKQPWE